MQKPGRLESLSLEEMMKLNVQHLLQSLAAVSRAEFQFLLIHIRQPHADQLLCVTSHVEISCNTYPYIGIQEIKMLRNVFLFIYIYILLKISLELSFGSSLNQRTRRYNAPAKSTYLRQKNQRNDILLSKDWLSQRVRELLQ